MGPCRAAVRMFLTAGVKSRHVPTQTCHHPSTQRLATISGAGCRPTATALCLEVFGAEVCESSDSR